MSESQLAQGSLAGRVAVVTGANTGIGKVTALELAKLGAHVILACRSQAKTEEAIADIRRDIPDAKLAFLELDLARLESVRAAAAKLLEEQPRIDLLINNAGLAGQRGATEEGFELAFGVNHLGHYLFTRLLLERIVQSAPARIVNVSSKSHYDAKQLDFGILQRPTAAVTGLPEYAVSKLSNVLFTTELAKRLKGTGVTTYSLHPGVVASDVWRSVPWPFRGLIKLFMISNQEGAQTTLHCATSEAAGAESGLYYDKSRARTPSKLAQDADLAKRLWDQSAEWVGLDSEVRLPKAESPTPKPAVESGSV